MASENAFTQDEIDALQLFKQEKSAQDVFAEMSGRGLDAEAAAGVFNSLLERGYSFLPGLSRYAVAVKEYGVKPRVDRAEMNKWLEERAVEEDRKLLREEHPVMSRIAPDVYQGELKDARKGENEDGVRGFVKDFNRAWSSGMTLPARAAGSVVGTAANAALGTNWHMADMDDLESAANDPWLVPSMVIPAGAAVKAVKGGTKLAKVGRFGVEAATDAAGSYASSRVSDMTPEIELGEALIGGGVGTTVGRGLSKEGRGAVRDAARNVVDFVGEKADNAVRRLTSVGAGGESVVRPKGKVPDGSVKDAALEYAMSEKGLNVPFKDIPTTAYWGVDGLPQTAGQLERTIGTSPVGENVLERFNNFEQKLNDKLDEVLKSKVGDYEPSTDAFETMTRLRESWPQIKEAIYETGFNFSNNFNGELADALVEKNSQRLTELLDFVDGDRKEFAEALKELTTPENSLKALNDRAFELEKQIDAIGAGALTKAEQRELGDFIGTLRQALSATDIDPIGRLERLDRARQSIKNYVKEHADDVNPSGFTRFVRRMEGAIKQDIQSLIRSGWFEELGDEAGDYLHQEAVRDAIFERGHKVLRQFIDKETFDEQKFANFLSSASKSDKAAIRDALLLAGDEGAKRLVDMQRTALSASVRPSADGVKWGLSEQKLKNNLEGIGQLGDDGGVFDEITNILELGRRMGSKIEPGSASARNYKALTILRDNSRLRRLNKNKAKAARAMGVELEEPRIGVSSPETIAILEGSEMALPQNRIGALAGERERQQNDVERALASLAGRIEALKANRQTQEGE